MNRQSKLLQNKLQHQMNTKKELKVIRMKVLQSTSKQYKRFMVVQHQYKVTKLKKNLQPFRNQDRLYKIHRIKIFKKTIKIHK